MSKSTCNVAGQARDGQGQNGIRRCSSLGLFILFSVVVRQICFLFGDIHYYVRQKFVLSRIYNVLSVFVILAYWCKKKNEWGFRPPLCTSAKLGQEDLLRIWHCPPDAEFEIGALAIWGRVRYLSVTEAPLNIEYLRVSEEETFFLWNLKAMQSGVLTRDLLLSKQAILRGPWCPLLIWSSVTGTLCSYHT